MVAKEVAFVKVPRWIVESPDLSWKEKGICAYFLAKPTGWKFHLREMAQHACDGIEAVQTGIQHLIKKAVVARKRIRGPKGEFIGFDYRVSKIKPSIHSNYTERFPVSGKPVYGNPVHGEESPEFMAFQVAVYGRTKEIADASLICVDCGLSVDVEALSPLEADWYRETALCAACFGKMCGDAPQECFKPCTLDEVG